MSARGFGRHLLHGAHVPERFADHAPGLHKWWKAYVRTNGRITEHISPYQQRIVSPLFRDPVGKLKHKIFDNWHVVPGAVIFYATGQWADAKFEQLQMNEWP